MKKVVLYTLYPDLIKEVEVSSNLSLYENEEEIIILDLSAVNIKELNKLFFKVNIDKFHILYKYNYNGRKFKLFLDNVLYFESEHRIINVYTIDGQTFKFYRKLDDVQKEIDGMCDFFIRVSKSLYVNYMFSDIKGYKVTIIDGRMIDVTRTYREYFKNKMRLLKYKCVVLYT